MHSELEAIAQGKVLPHNLDIEQALIGSILLSPKAIEAVSGVVAPDGFYESNHGVIYQAAIALHQQSRHVDINTVAAFLSDCGQLTKVGGKATLVRIQDATPYGVNIGQYAALVRGYHIRRQIIETAQKISEAAYDTSQDLDQVVQDSEKMLFAVTQQHTKGQGFRSVADLVTDFFSDVEKRSQAGVLPGLPTGFYDLDSATNGFKAGKSVYLIGRPSMGKSAIALQMADYFAYKVNCTVAYFSLEMPAEELVQRMVASESRIAPGNLEAGRIGQNDWEPLGHAVSRLANTGKLKIDDTPGVSIEDIASKCRGLQSESGDLGAVFIDHLHLLNYGKRSEVEALTSITKQIKNLARELKIPIFTLAQLNRGVEERTNKRPMMSDIRGCGTAEQDADIIAGLYRDEYYNENTVDRGIAEVILLKHRGGPTCTIKLLFEPQFTCFKNLASSRNADMRKPPTPPSVPQYSYQPPTEQRDRALQNLLTNPSDYGDEF